MAIDPRALRSRRLSNEHDELMRISGNVIRIEPLGRAPFEKYKITFNINTIIGAGPRYRKKTVCTLTIPPGYPEAVPSIVADETPYPFHINWWSSGSWCFGRWSKEETLVNFISRCAKTLQFDPEIANPDSMANRDALSFWESNRNNRGIIPCDTQILPTLETPQEPMKISIKPKTAEAPKITINVPSANKPKIVIR